MWSVFSHWKIFGLQMPHDLRQRRSTSWISHSFRLMWIKLTVLSHIFVVLQSLWREEGFGAKIVCRHEWIPDSSLKKYCSCACEVTRYHTLVSRGRWFTDLRLDSLYTLAYSQDANEWIGHQQLFFSKQMPHSASLCLCRRRRFLEQLLWILIGAGNVPKL